MRESDFQKNLIKEIQQRLPYAIILKNDATHVQGIPDLSIFCGNRYAMLEVKIDEKASRQPNQGYYINRFQQMGTFASFIFPENKAIVLDAMERYLMPAKGGV